MNQLLTVQSTKSMRDISYKRKLFKADKSPRDESRLPLRTSTHILPAAGGVPGRVRLRPLYRRPEMAIEGDLVARGIRDVLLPRSNAIAIRLVVDRLSADTIGSPLVSMCRRRIVIRPLQRREQLIVEDDLVARGVLARRVA